MLMRAGGVPARVVTGYLGGNWNRYGGYLLVTPIRRACLDRSLARRSRLGARRSDRGRGAGTPDAKSSTICCPPQARGHRLLLDSPWVADTVQAWQGLNAWWQDEFVGFNFSQAARPAGRLGIRDHDLQALACCWPRAQASGWH